MSPPRPGRVGLPTPLNRCFGRGREISQIVEALHGATLVTLTGPPGIGKTRLALEVAAQQVERFRDGAVFVDLAALAADDEQVPTAIAAALGLKDVSMRSPTDTLAQHLSDMSVVLVLDNCEHVVEGSALLAERLRRDCPGLRILATSRELLRIPGEAVVIVPPLAVPLEDDVSPDLLAQYEAVALFLDRIQGREQLSPVAVRGVAEVCRRLDGIPLAIELAAARVGALSSGQIADRLDDRFRLLTGGVRTAPPRHRTLLAAVEWSWDLLSPAEGALLRRLSVFVGGWTLEAAEGICAGRDLERGEILDVLAQLVGKSLVACDVEGEEARYRLLETIRAYGREQLASHGEETALRRAHAAWFTRLAGRAELELSGRDQATWLRSLETELPNLRSAIAWSALDDKPETALAIASGLTLFWLVRGRLLEGREWLEKLLAQTPDAPPSARGRALWGSGFLSAMLGDFRAAELAGARALELFRDLEDDRGMARSLNLLGVIEAHRNPPASRPLLEESIVRARTASDAWCLAESLGMRAFAAAFEGDFASAGPPFEECLQVARTEGNQQGLRMSLLGLGYVALQRGDDRLSAALLGDGLDIACELADPLWTAVAHVYGGELRASQGDHGEAIDHQQRALALARQSGSPFFLGFCLGFLGKTVLAGGDAARAKELFVEALALPRGSGHKSNFAISLLGLAEAELRLGDTDAALQALKEAQSIAAESGDRLVLSWIFDAEAGRCRRAADWERARALYQQSLALKVEIGQRSGFVGSLEKLAGLAADEGRFEHAARLFAAADSFREQRGHGRSPVEEAVCKADRERARAGLGEEAFAAAWEQGARLDLDDAVALALRRVVSRRPQSTGWESLTKAERDVVRLVREGLTNPEIGRRLCISRRTVQAHLAHVYTKLDMHSRGELSVEATARGM